MVQRAFLLYSRRVTTAIPPSPNLPATPAAPSTPLPAGSAELAAAAPASFAASAAAAVQGTGATPPAAPVAPSSAVTDPAQVARIVAAAQAALADSVNLSLQAQQAVKMEAFQQLVANLVNQIRPSATSLSGNWPTQGVPAPLQTLLNQLLQQATASQPLPQQLVSAQPWPTTLTNAVLQLAAGLSPASSHLPVPGLPPGAPPTATSGTAPPRDFPPLPALQNWLVQQGVVQGTDGERAFTLTLRVPVAWAQAQAALGTALPTGATATPAAAAGAALLAATPGAAGMPAGSTTLAGLLQLPFAGSVQQLSSGSLGLVMQPQVLPGTPAAAAAQAMRTSAILQLEFQPLAQAVQSAQAAVYMPGHLLPQDVQAMLQNRGTDPWVLLAQGHAQGQGKKSSKNANEQAQYCNRAGCQYQGRAICAQPFCAEMNYLWSIDRAQRRA